MKKVSKHICSLALAVSMTMQAFLFTGCSDNSSASNASQNTASSSSTKLSGSITVGSWDIAARALTANAKEFMAQNPGTTITIQDEDKTYKGLYAQLDSGNGVPDIITLQNRDVASFVNKYPDMGTDVLDIMKPEEKNSNQYVKNLMIVKNKFYAVPWDMGPCALYYRKDIFQAAQIDPASIKTYDDYIAAGKKIVAKTKGKTKLLGFDYSGSSSTDTLLLLLSQLGAKFYDNSGRANLSSAAMLQALNLEKKMVAAGVAMNLPNEEKDRATALSQDHLATVPNAVWFAGTLQAIKNQKGKWGIIPLPAFAPGGNTHANVGGSALIIHSKTKNPALAKAFVKFSLLTNEGNKINFDTSKLFSSYLPAYKDAEYSEVDDFFGVSMGTVFTKLTTNIPAMNFGPYFTDINDQMKTVTKDILINGKNPDTVLKAASEAAEKAIESE